MQKIYFFLSCGCYHYSSVAVYMSVWLTVFVLLNCENKMIWIVIGKMFSNQSFTENKAVINVKQYKYLARYLTRDKIC